MPPPLASTRQPINAWTGILSVGNEQIDNDHRYLFYLAAKVRAQAQNGHRAELVRSVLDELLTYAHVHFEREEALMTEMNYPDRHDHVVEHKLLAYQLRKLSSRCACGGRVTNEDLDLFLDRWMARHILTADLDLAKSLHAVREEAAHSLG